MKMETRYLGLTLRHPFMPGASPIVDDLDQVRAYEDAGASAFVMHSLFEEQLVAEAHATHAALEEHGGAFAEATGMFLPLDRFTLGPDAYLEQIRRIRQACAVPVIGSLNGTTRGGWLEYARLIEQAGAHALELNVYSVAADMAESPQALEDGLVAMVRDVCGRLSIPVAVKLSPYFTSLGHLARRLVDAGAQGLVLFNRFYQADIDVEALEVQRSLKLSSPTELLVRLRWLAILDERVHADLAASGGVHSVEDAVKALMAGADAVQMVSALLRGGPAHLKQIVEGVSHWGEEHGYAAVDELRGCMNLRRAPDPKAYERANYVHILQSWRPPLGHAPRERVAELFALRKLE